MSDSHHIQTTEKIERTDTGARLTVESTRGTGTRDQDKVKAELRVETLSELADARSKATATVKATLEDMRLFPDPSEGSDE